MTINGEIIVEPGHLCVRCTGSCRSVSDLEQIFEQAVDGARSEARSSILIDAGNLTGALSMMDRYQGAAFLAAIAMQEPSAPITAIAVAGPKPLVDPARFGETAARNRGLNARVFLSVDEALEWLASPDR